MLRLIIIFWLILPSLAQAGVIETNEWDNLSRPNWFYGGRPMSIDNSAGSPSGGGALKLTFGPGSQTESITGGIARYQYQQGYAEVYFGHWIKWSNNWLWHPIGSKINYFDANVGSDGFQSNVLTAIAGDGNNTGGCRSGLLQTVQRIWDSGSYNMPQNQWPNYCPGQWYWLEWHLKMNTPGSANGIYELWVNGVLVSSVLNMALAGPTQNGVWQDAQHSPEYGGGGFANIPSEQYIWIDHTVISTTRIGMPGTASGGDTTPPVAPVGLRIQ